MNFKHTCDRTNRSRSTHCYFDRRQIDDLLTVLRNQMDFKVAMVTKIGAVIQLGSRLRIFAHLFLKLSWRTL